MNFTFDPSKCKECGGKCCRGKPGFVWVSKDELEKIADFLHSPVQDLEKFCVKKIGDRLSIKDVAWRGERVCFFFDTTKNNCSIYQARPSQCKIFPFWEGVSKEYLEKECIAVSF